MGEEIDKETGNERPKQANALLLQSPNLESQKHKALAAVARAYDVGKL
jgi:hypothetical protein